MNFGPSLINYIALAGTHVPCINVVIFKPPNTELVMEIFRLKNVHGKIFHFLQVWSQGLHKDINVSQPEESITRPDTQYNWYKILEY